MRLAGGERRARGGRESRKRVTGAAASPPPAVVEKRPSPWTATLQVSARLRLRNDDDIGEFDLVDEEVGDGAFRCAGGTWHSVRESLVRWQHVVAAADVEHAVLGRATERVLPLGGVQLVGFRTEGNKKNEGGKKRGMKDEP
jgi:hypothetical protein